MTEFGIVNPHTGDIDPIPVNRSHPDFIGFTDEEKEQELRSRFQIEADSARCHEQVAKFGEASKNRYREATAYFKKVGEEQTDKARIASLERRVETLEHALHMQAVGLSTVKWAQPRHAIDTTPTREELEALLRVGIQTVG